MKKASRFAGAIALGVALTIVASSSIARAAASDDGSVLPFPPTPSASVAAETLQESTHRRRVEKSRLPKDAPNIVIILLDDVGFGMPDTLGGEVHTPTLTRLAKEGIRYNAFHTTAICSPTRAALLTGRNHQRVGKLSGVGLEEQVSMAHCGGMHAGLLRIGVAGGCASIIAWRWATRK